MMTAVASKAVRQAVILPFPPRRNAERQRLALALGGLEQALAEQRQAVETWRSTLANARAAVSGLQDRLHGQTRALDTLAGQLGRLGAQSRRLQGWAETGAPR